MRKDGTSLIFLQYCYSATKRVLIGLDIGIPEIYWNKKTCSISSKLPSEYGDVAKLEADLREKLPRAEKLIDYAIHNAKTCPMQFLKRNFSRTENRLFEQKEYDQNKLDFFYQIEKYIRDKTGLVQDTTLTTIRSMKKQL